MWTVCAWREWAAPAVTSHYSTKQVLSSPIFQLQQQNAHDRSFGYSSLEVHMANMIMTVTDRIKMTFTDGGWQHSLLQSESQLVTHFSAPNHLKEVCDGNYLANCQTSIHSFLLLSCCRLKSCRRPLKRSLIRV